MGGGREVGERGREGVEKKRGWPRVPSAVSAPFSGQNGNLPTAGYSRSLSAKRKRRCLRDHTHGVANLTVLAPEIYLKNRVGFRFLEG